MLSSSSCNRFLPWQNDSTEQKVMGGGILTLWCQVFLFYFIYLCLSLCLEKVPTLVCWYTVLPNHAVWFPVASSFVLKNNNSICSCGSRRCYNCGRVEKCNTSRCVWFICSFLLLRRLSKFSLPSFLCPGVHSPPTHPSLHVWLDFKGLLEGWQPSLTSQSCREEDQDCREMKVKK